MAIRFVRERELLYLLGKRRSTKNNDIRRGLLPRGVPLGPREIGWPEHEIEAINCARLRGASAEDVKALVTKLEAERLAYGADHDHQHQQELSP